MYVEGQPPGPSRSGSPPRLTAPVGIAITGAWRFRNPFLLYLRSRLNVTVAVVSLAALVAGLALFRGRRPARARRGRRALRGASPRCSSSRAAAPARWSPRRTRPRGRRSGRRSTRRPRSASASRCCASATRSFGSRSRTSCSSRGSTWKRRAASGTWSPHANDRIRQALEVCQIVARREGRELHGEALRDRGRR